MPKERTIQCVKCKKEKKENEGRYILEGSTFCCKKCCGDPSKEEHKKKEDNVCEFC